MKGLLKNRFLKNHTECTATYPPYLGVVVFSCISKSRSGLKKPGFTILIQQHLFARAYTVGNLFLYFLFNMYCFFKVIFSYLATKYASGNITYILTASTFKI